jgi:hypothetical protein
VEVEGASAEAPNGWMSIFRAERAFDTGTMRGPLQAGKNRYAGPSFRPSSGTVPRTRTATRCTLCRSPSASET